MHFQMPRCAQCYPSLGTNNQIQRCGVQRARAMGVQLSDFGTLLPIEKAATTRALDRCRRLSRQIAHSLESVPEMWADTRSLAEVCASLEMAAEILQSTEERRLSPR
jgi:hypothetical protein